MLLIIDIDVIREWRGAQDTGTVVKEIMGGGMKHNRWVIGGGARTASELVVAR
jgi:hypothetical protein